MTVHFNLAFSTENIGPVAPFLYQLIKHWHQFPRTMIISWKFNARFAYFPVISLKKCRARFYTARLAAFDTNDISMTAFNTYGFKFIPLPMIFFKFSIWVQI